MALNLAIALLTAFTCEDVKSIYKDDDKCCDAPEKVSSLCSCSGTCASIEDRLQAYVGPEPLKWSDTISNYNDYSEYLADVTYMRIHGRMPNSTEREAAKDFINGDPVKALQYYATAPYTPEFDTARGVDLNVDLTGKVYIVPGVSGGMGFQAAYTLRKMGAKVYGFSRTPHMYHAIVASAMKEAYEQTMPLEGYAGGVDLPGIADIEYRQGDVRNETFLEELFDEVYATEGRLDGVFTAAGAAESFCHPSGDLQEIKQVPIEEEMLVTADATGDGLQSELNTRFWGVLYIIKQIVRIQSIQEGSKISLLIIGSTAGVGPQSDPLKTNVSPLESNVAYNIAKMTEVMILARIAAFKGVRTNVVNPYVVTGRTFSVYDQLMKFCPQTFGLVDLVPDPSFRAVRDLVQDTWQGEGTSATTRSPIPLSYGVLSFSQTYADEIFKNMTHVPGKGPIEPPYYANSLFLVKFLTMGSPVQSNFDFVLGSADPLLGADIPDPPGLIARLGVSLLIDEESNRVVRTRADPGMLSDVTGLPLASLPSSQQLLIDPNARRLYDAVLASFHAGKSTSGDTDMKHAWSYESF